MGAPALTWIFRVLVTLTALAGATAVLWLPWPLLARGALLSAGAAAACAVAWRFVPAFDPLGRVRWRLPRPTRDARTSSPPRRCALTFDDGPSPSTGAVLDILAREDVPATFFVLGSHAVRHPDLVRRMHAEGHAVGLHGSTHRTLHGAGEDEVERQVGGAIASLAGLGVPHAPVYRAPHGFKSPRVFEVARHHGLAVWAWSRGVWDTDRPRPDVLVRRATRFARSGMVLLLHDGRGEERSPDVSAMLSALPGIIRDLRARRFTFVRLTDV
jgi:peptidoglycan/xylan/chitin deacetylase (PgdA/CDA1 family)